MLGSVTVVKSQTYWLKPRAPRNLCRSEQESQVETLRKRERIGQRVQWGVCRIALDCLATGQRPGPTDSMGWRSYGCWSRVSNPWSEPASASHARGLPSTATLFRSPHGHRQLLMQDR